MTKHSIPCEMINRNSKNTLKNKKTRELRMESLECRQLLSVSPSSAPAPDDVETIFSAPAIIDEAPESTVIMNFSDTDAAILPTSGTEVKVNAGDDLAAAITSAADGTTITVAAGTYDIGAVSIAKSNLTIQGSGDVNLQGSLTITGDNITLDSLKFADTDTYNSGTILTIGASTNVLTINNCEFGTATEGSARQAIQSNTPTTVESRDITISNSKFYTGVSGSTWRNTMILDEYHGFTITDNTFHAFANANGSAGRVIMGYNSCNYADKHVTITNNTFTTDSTNMGDACIRLKAKSNCTGENIIITDNYFEANLGFKIDSDVTAENAAKIDLSSNYWVVPGNKGGNEPLASQVREKGTDGALPDVSTWATSTDKTEDDYYKYLAARDGAEVSLKKGQELTIYAVNADGTTDTDTVVGTITATEDMSGLVVVNEAQLTAAIKNCKAGDTIVLGADIKATNTVEFETSVPDNVTLDGGSHKLTGHIYAACENLTIKNLTIQGYQYTANDFATIHQGAGSLTVDSVSFTRIVMKPVPATVSSLRANSRLRNPNSTTA